jgi:hypothetical protein
MPSFQTDGVIADMTASQPLGGLSTGIGVGPNRSHLQPTGLPNQSPTTADFVAKRIGGAPDGVVNAFGAAYSTGKGTQYKVATAAVAVGAAVAPSTYLNRSPRALNTGDGVWAVAP